MLQKQSKTFLPSSLNALATSFVQIIRRIRLSTIVFELAFPAWSERCFGHRVKWCVCQKCCIYCIYFQLMKLMVQSKRPSLIWLVLTSGYVISDSETHNRGQTMIGQQNKESSKGMETNQVQLLKPSSSCQADNDFVKTIYYLISFGYNKFYLN